MSEFPLIQIEFRNIKSVIARAFTDAQIKLDTEFSAALEAAMSPHNIDRIVRESVNLEVNSLVKEKVRNFFKYGEGNKALSEFIVEELNRSLEVAKEYKEFRAKELKGDT